MQALHCPICGKGGLLQAEGALVRNKRLVVCENEHFQHWKLAGNHFLTKTQENIREELEDSFHVERDLVLN